MKKWIAAMAVIMALICVAAAADGHIITSEQSVNVDISMTVDESYQQTIPAELPITYGAQSAELSVRITELHLNSGNVLQVCADTEGRLTNPDDSTNFIAFSIQGESETQDGSARLVFDNVGEKQLTVNVAQEEWRNAMSGCTYTGVITFSFSIEERAEGDDNAENE